MPQIEPYGTQPQNSAHSTTLIEATPTASGLVLWPIPGIRERPELGGSTIVGRRKRVAKLVMLDLGREC
jgi:hypothetical protein